MKKRFLLGLSADRSESSDIFSLGERSDSRRNFQ